jgi:hypothetical protein
LSTDRQTIDKRLTAAYAAADPGAKSRRRLAATFTPNPELEFLAGMPAHELALIMTPTLRMTLGSYIAAKAAAEELAELEKEQL